MEKELKNREKVKEILRNNKFFVKREEKVKENE